MQTTQMLRKAARTAASAGVTPSSSSVLRNALSPTSTSMSGASAARLLSIASSSSSSVAQQQSQNPRRNGSRLPRAAPSSQVLRALESSSRSYASAAATGPIPTSALVEISQLPNKVTVATEATPGHFSSLGIYVDVGSRYERQYVPGESGVCHLLDRMAFKSTSRRTAEDMTKEISQLGGNFFCSSSRETLMYQASIFNQDLEAALDVLADTVLNPLLSDEELATQKEAAAYEIREIAEKPDMILPEILHNVAYANNTLGYPLLCPSESLPVMSAKTLRDFVDAWYTPDRIVVAGAGMTHQALVNVAQKHFGHLTARDTFPDGSLHLSSSSSAGSISSRSSTPSSSLSGSSSSLSSSSIGSADFSTSSTRPAQHAPAPELSLAAQASAPARYTGGEQYISSPDLEFTHVYVAFEGFSVHDDDIYALATLQILLGGGGSFSAGGPGKGMYSRLYSNVLNRHHQVDFCAAFHHCYNDSGLFGIAASVHHSFVGSIPQIIARELESLMEHNSRSAVTQAELSRARNQLKSSLVMALESRLVEVEDLGRQVQVHGKKVSVEEMCSKIDQVDLPRLRRVAARVLRPTITASSRGSGMPTVVAQGSLDGLGDVRSYLANRGLGLSPSGSDVGSSTTSGSTSRSGLFRRVLGGGSPSRGLHTSARVAAGRTSTSSSEEIPKFFRPQTREERRSEGPPSRHILFYRDIVPPLFRVLAYGSIVYFGLHLTWVVLDREEQDARHASEISGLQGEIRKLKEDAESGVVQVVEKAEVKAKSWWSSLTGR
ncbi:hypothetical protein CF319_g4200 [Tilletia indica]|nr:hypothetical protein CF319_g4200 [Tilletia indica]